jgi:hypothetical protein
MTTINYEVDIIAWANEQAWLVRNRKFELIDVEHIAEESDWDFLILVDGPVSDERTDRIRHSLYEIEWESGEVISSIVRNREEWNSDLYQAMPFHRRVQQEGIRL